MKRLKSATELEELRGDILSQRDPHRACLVTSVGTCGLACGAKDVVKAISKTLSEFGLEDSIYFRTTGCHGFCEIEPVITIYPERIVYQQVTPRDIPEIISESVIKNKVIDRLLYTDSTTGEKIIHEQDIPFYNKQNRLLLDNNRFINPHSIEDYLAVGGYSALAKALCSMQPEEIIDEIKEVGLKGTWRRRLPHPG